KLPKEKRYKYMMTYITTQLEIESDVYANISNASAILFAILENINWSGFYFMRGGELVLGPFQGLPACNRIKVGKGVCGTSVEKREVQRISNVHEFEGHIACDSASNSEIVIPIIKNDKVYGVLDIDSFEYDNFSELEEEYLVKFVEKLNEKIDWELL
ncbi:MAG: GAF domain-containing protein, partial [Clostridioides sp.]|nr:GAF domain-containing protein [Clostridioides sp.]